MGEVDVLVVGAGPTGLALAVAARTNGASVRIVDRAPSEAHESRALVLQPRTLEVLAGTGVTARLLARGRRTVWLQLHGDGHAATVPLFDLGVDDTPYPFLLFLSQAETEAALAARLAEQGVTVEHGTELVDLTQDRESVRCQLRRGDRTQEVTARYAVGCDGGGSTVRRVLGIDFAGDRYPQRFALADVEVDGSLRADTVHAFLGPSGMLFLFPLGHPRPWRVMGMLPPFDDAPSELTLAAVQALVDEHASGLRLHDPAWLSDFRLRHRLADRYRDGRVFLAGDAAHVHSPAGGQGMNVGIQDAANLGWKLAAVSGGADPSLLDSYEAERRPVGRATVGFTDRLFSIATSRRAPIRLARTTIAPRILPVLARVRPLRAAAYRRLADLDVTYRTSPAVHDTRGRLAPPPRAGDRLPDAPVAPVAPAGHGGPGSPAGPGGPGGPGESLHQLVAAPGHHLLLCGRWTRPDQLTLPGVSIHVLGPDDAPAALARLHVRGHAQLLVRPDGHIAYRADGTDLTGLRTHLAQTFPLSRSR